MTRFGQNVAIIMAIVLVGFSAGFAQAVQKPGDRGQGIGDRQKAEVRSQKSEVSQPPAANPQSPTANPQSLALSADDQRQLDLINAQISQMKPQIEAAQKQQADAQAKMNEANAFLAAYNQVEAARMAFFFRIAADVCHCESKELQFSADGKSVVRKFEVRSAKSGDESTAKTPGR